MLPNGDNGNIAKPIIIEGRRSNLRPCRILAEADLIVILDLFQGFEVSHEAIIFGDIPSEMWILVAPFTGPRSWVIKTFQLIHIARMPGSMYQIHDLHCTVYAWLVSVQRSLDWENNRPDANDFCLFPIQICEI